MVVFGLFFYFSMPFVDEILFNHIIAHWFELDQSDTVCFIDIYTITTSQLGNPRDPSLEALVI